MKKILEIILVIFISYNLSAQNASPSGNARVATLEESKKANGNVETMINGRPYSQWAAEQKAKQPTENNKQAIRVVVLDANNTINGQVQVNKTQPNPIQAKATDFHTSPVSTDTKSEPVVTNEDLKTNSRVIPGVSLPSDVKIGIAPASVESKQAEIKTGPTTPGNTANSPVKKAD